MVIATSIFSIALVAVNAKGVSRLSPARFVPWAFAVSAVLLVARVGADATRRRSSPPCSCTCTSPGSDLFSVPGSGWSPPSASIRERPRRKFGQIAGGGTFGGLLGGLLAERVAVHVRRRRHAAGAGDSQSRVRLAGSAPGAGADVAAAVQRVLGRADAGTGMVGRARACRNAVPAPSRAARSARHDERGADRLRVQGAGGRGARNRRESPEILRASTTQSSASSRSPCRPR